MKVNLSKRATEELLHLHESLGGEVSLTHFLNTLISKEYAMISLTNNIPQIEDLNNEAEQERQPR